MLLERVFFSKNVLLVVLLVSELIEVIFDQSLLIELRSHYPAVCNVLNSVAWTLGYVGMSPIS